MPRKYRNFNMRSGRGGPALGKRSGTNSLNGGLFASLARCGHNLVKRNRACGTKAKPKSSSRASAWAL
jgi:hypothetical protein